VSDSMGPSHRRAQPGCFCQVVLIGTDDLQLKRKAYCTAETKGFLAGIGAFDARSAELAFEASQEPEKEHAEIGEE
jgi:hypothetical protein